MEITRFVRTDFMFLSLIRRLCVRDAPILVWPTSQKLNGRKSFSLLFTLSSLTATADCQSVCQSFQEVIASRATSVNITWVIFNRVIEK